VGFFQVNAASFSFGTSLRQISRPKLPVDFVIPYSQRNFYGFECLSIILILLSDSG
jgi:hypothetical protein